MAHPQAEPALRQEVRGVRHRLHASRDGELELAVPERVRGVHDGAHARAADLVERDGARALREAGAEERLTRGRLALAGLQDVAHPDAARRAAAAISARSTRRP